MKRFITSTILLISLSNISFGQNINISMSSIETLLCKKWEVDYALVGGMKIGMLPGGEEIDYEFNKDKTFVLTSNGRVDKVKGTWSYDSKKKQIKLTSNGESKTTIIALKEGEMTMITDTKNVTPDDPEDLTIVYKIKGN